MAVKYYLGELIPEGIGTVSKVAQLLDLEDVYLLEAKIGSDPSSRSPSGAELDYKFDIEILSKNDKELNIKCKFIVMAHRKEENYLMQIEATYLLRYSIENPNKLSIDDIDKFAKIHPIYNAWPYWREFVQNLTSRMGFPALTIPLLRFVTAKSETEKPEKSKPMTAKKKSPTRKAK